MRQIEKVINQQEKLKEKSVEDIYNILYKKKENREFINMQELFDAERAILNSGNTRIMILWAMNIGNGKSEKMENAIIKIGDPQAIYEFAVYVNCSNKHKLRKAIMATKDKFWIRQWKACFGIEGLFF